MVALETYAFFFYRPNAEGGCAIVLHVKQAHSGR